jgi:hypothetical protein
MLMWKKGVLASIVAGLLVSMAAYPLRAADYKHSGCSEAAKMRFPTDHAARKQFKRWCKDQWKIYKKGHP